MKAYYRCVYVFFQVLSVTFDSIHASRRALCYVQVLKPKLGVVDFKKVLALEPSNAVARAQLDTTQKLIRKTEFEKVCTNFCRVVVAGAFSVERRSDGRLYRSLRFLLGGYPLDLD